MNVILSALEILKKHNYKHKKIKEIKEKIINEIKEINKELKLLFLKEKKLFENNLAKKQKLY
jgi:hypothetical protein